MSIYISGHVYECHIQHHIVYSPYLSSLPCPTDLVFQSLLGHCEWVVGKLIVLCLPWLNTDGLRTGPVLPVNDWVEQPACGRLVV